MNTKLFHAIWLPLVVLLTTFSASAQQIQNQAGMEVLKTRTFSDTPAPVQINPVVVRNQSPGSFGQLAEPLKWAGISTDRIIFDEHITRDQATGTPVKAEGMLTLPNFPESSNVLQTALNVLNNLKQVYQIERVEEEFLETSRELDGLGIWHLKFQQMFKGLPVYGAQQTVHFYRNGKFAVLGRGRSTPNLDKVLPNLDEETASGLAVAHLANYTHVRELNPTEQEMLKYERPKAELVIYTPDNQEKAVLTWHFTVRPNFVERWEYFVDANTGEVLDFYNNTCALGPTTSSGNDLSGTNRTFNSFEFQGTWYMLDASRPMYTGSVNQLPVQGQGFIGTFDLQNTQLSNPSYVLVSSPNNTWNHPSAISAHYNAGLSYEYFRTTFNRNSINGQGSDLISFVNVPDQNGQGLDNAFWNGEFMFYGNGNVAFFPLARALDVAAHEMSHGVIQHTANLEYKNESGAINESFADVFGVMVDRDDWTLAEEIVKIAHFPSGAMRSMSDPHNGGSSLNDNGWQPKHVSEMYTGTQDNGGVHINSGITNYAFFLIATNTSKSQAEQIYYRALTQYLTKSSRFVDLRIAIVQAATDLHGAGSAQVNAVHSAFDAVGIAPGQGGNYQDNLPTNPGNEAILFVDANSADPVTLYLTNPQGSSFTPISQTPVLRKPSVTDDGSVAVFVGTDKNLYYSELQQNGQTFQLTTDQFWDNVAVSKDGSKLAGVSVNADTSIYVYDFGTQQWAKYVLYNPTTGQGGLNMGGVLYADAIEWDYTGQYLIYDAYNKLTNTQGADLDYWDVGFLRVWNNATNNWGDGSILKLFTGLQEGISIGNPTYSKNSPHIVGFDLVNSVAQEIYILGANIETGNVGTIWQNAILGFCSYSKNDGKMVFSALDNANKEVIAVVSLNQDKITPSGQPSVLIEDARYAVWLSQGTRPLPTGVERPKPVSKTEQLKAWPNPVSGILTVEIAHRAEGSILEVHEITGKKLMEQVVPSNGTGVVTLDVRHLEAGCYILTQRSMAGLRTGTARIIKY